MSYMPNVTSHKSQISQTNIDSFSDNFNLVLTATTYIEKEREQEQGYSQM